MSAEEDPGRGAFAPLTAGNLKRHNRLCAAADAAATPGLSDEERRMRFCADFARDQLERVGLVWRVPVRIADGVEAATAPVHSLARPHGATTATEPQTVVIGHLRQGSEPTPPATARVVARMSPRDAAGLTRAPGPANTPAVAAGRARDQGSSGSPAGKRAATVPRLVVPAPAVASPAVKSTGRLTVGDARC
jgi:hypothetical protein